ncbi:hypothetical protein BBP40_009299, partial [Aspergillus hancockii]
EQKLYDLGTSVADVSRSLSTKAAHRLAESAVDPRQLLWGILTTLSRIRGSQSYLFPALVEQCRGILSFDCTLSMGDFLPPFTATAPASISWRPGEAGGGFDMLTVSDSIHEQENEAGDAAAQIVPAGQISSEISF